MKNDGCPCLYTEPCRSSCTCANPGLSGGCGRCAKYGSNKQQKAAAEYLAKIINAGSKTVENVAFGLFCKEKMISDYNTRWIKEKDMEMLKDMWKDILRSLTEEHFGDCTNDACSCGRCYVDTFFKEAKLILEHI